MIDATGATEKMKAEKGTMERNDWGFCGLISFSQTSIIFPS